VKPANAAQAGALSTPVLPSEQPEQTRDTPSRPGALVSHPLRVGVVTVATAALAFASYPTIARSALAAFFAGVLIVLAAIDLEHRIIPNKIVLPATAIVLAAHIAIEPGRTVELIVAPLAAAVFLFLPNLFTSSAIGMGDVKLALLLGAGLGWGVIGALLIGFLATVPFAIAVLIRGGAAARKTMLPLGPFLAFGGLVILIVPRL
jgi:leader peptidase (prepilin peptidase) / N-methyltransferase